MLTRVAYRLDGGFTQGFRAFGSKAAAVMWIMDQAERQKLTDIVIDDQWDPDCVGYETDDIRRHLPFPECCAHHGSAKCDCGLAD